MSNISTNWKASIKQYTKRKRWEILTNDIQGKWWRKYMAVILSLRRSPKADQIVHQGLGIVLYSTMDYRWPKPRAGSEWGKSFSFCAPTSLKKLAGLKHTRLFVSFPCLRWFQHCCSFQADWYFQAKQQASQASRNRSESLIFHNISLQLESCTLLLHTLRYVTIKVRYSVGKILYE